MKNGSLGILLGSLRVMTVSMLAQGSLTPPSAPTPTMKSLDQVQPRTPISSLPFTISTPGSYYLTANLTVTGTGNGIIVSADNVTIDLNGFAMILTNASGGIVSSIYAPAAQKNLCVRNGTIAGWSSDGMNLRSVTGGLYQKLRLVGSSHQGLAVGPGSQVEECVAISQLGSGIEVGVGSTVADCTASGNGTGSFGGHGFLLGNYCSIKGSTAEGNVTNGIQTGQNCTVLHCTADLNTVTGILASTGNTVADCTTGSNGVGINVDTGSTVRCCTVRSNHGHGIVLNSNCQIVGNTCDSNQSNGTDAGIFTSGSMSRIDSNNCTANFYGIRSTGSKNVIVRNTALGNTTANGAADYAFTGGDYVGPLYSTAGTITSTNPWANFGLSGGF